MSLNELNEHKRAGNYEIRVDTIEAAGNLVES